MLPSHLAVIGDPIDHSLSPPMQNAALEAAGLDPVYEARRVTVEDLPRQIDLLRATHRGFNVTIPHKVAVCPFLDEVEEAARKVGAVNTVINDGARLIGFNTDMAGFLLALHHVGVEARESRAVVFGSGGAARAVVQALANQGTRVTVVSRSRSKAESLARSVAGSAMTYGDVGLEAQLFGADLLVNATSLGMGKNRHESPLSDRAKLKPGAWLVDLVYGEVTPFQRQAQHRGCRVLDGLEMLVRQGAESFRLFTGLAADLNAMRAACRLELERRKLVQMADAR
jgi:shikimate dehydrogenase